MAEVNRNNAHKIDGYWGTIDKADVTLEGAYLQITGLTKAETNNARKEIMTAENEEPKQIPEKTEETISQEPKPNFIDELKLYKEDQTLLKLQN